MLAIDSNILVYGEGIGDQTRIISVRSLLASASRERIVVPAQVLAELFRVLVRKARLPLDTVRERIAQYERTAIVAPTLSSTLAAALDLAARQRFQVFDAVILAASAEARCRMLLSEDMQHGFVWRGVTVVNPFLSVRHPLLADLLRT